MEIFQSSNQIVINRTILIRTLMTWIPETLFKKIISVIPIACVDLVVVNPEKDILMVNRKNEPEKGEWWFPGRTYLLW